MSHNVELLVTERIILIYSNNIIASLVTLVYWVCRFQDTRGLHMHYSKYDIIITARSYWLRLVELRRIGFW